MSLQKTYFLVLIPVGHQYVNHGELAKAFIGRSHVAKKNMGRRWLTGEERRQLTLWVEENFISEERFWLGATVLEDPEKRRSCLDTFLQG
jgi:hypothetical protein